MVTPKIEPGDNEITTCQVADCRCSINKILVQLKISISPMSIITISLFYLQMSKYLGNIVTKSQTKSRVRHHKCLGAEQEVWDLTARETAEMRGDLPSPHTLLKSSVERSHTMAPPNWLLLMYSAFTFTISMSS